MSLRTEFCYGIAACLLMSISLVVYAEPECIPGVNCCPDMSSTSKPPQNWTVFMGKLDNKNAFKQAQIIYLGVMSNISCTYRNNFGEVTLQKIGYYKPDSRYWGRFERGYRCNNSLSTCTFIQYSKK